MKVNGNTDFVKIKKIKRKSGFRNDIDAWILMIPMVVLVYLFVWRPTVMGGALSFFNMRGYAIDKFCGMDNYIKVVTHTQFFPTLWTTVKFVLWSLTIGFIPPLFLAVMINEMVHFKNTFRVLIYIPAIIPGIAAMLMWYFMYYPDQTGLFNMVLAKFGIEPFGWLNNSDFVVLGLVIFMTWKGFPGTMLLYYSALQNVSAELYEAALIDGAGPFKRLWHVTRPAIEGLLLLNVVNHIIGVFQVMGEPLAMTGGGPNGASTTLSFQLYQYGFKSAGLGTGQAMALGVIIFMILITLTAFYFWLNRKVQNRY